MKILHLLDERWDSGITAYAIQIADLLHNHGMEVVVGVLSGKKPEIIAKSKNIPVASIDSVAALRKLINQNDWDIVNAHTGRMHSWVVLLKQLGLLKSNKFQIIRTRGDARLLRTSLASSFIYRFTPAVIAASEHIASQYTDWKAIKSYVEVNNPFETAEAASLFPDTFTVGILGRLDPVKGHSVFLEAAAYLIKKYPEAQFLIAGKEANIRSEVLINQMMALGLENQVKLLGFQPDAKEFMRKCSIGVIASVGSEEISRACLEWMSVGRPVVGTLVGCLPELIEPEETGSLVPAGDAYEMAQAMVRYADSRDLIKEHGAKAAHFIAEKFSPDIILNKTLSLYQKILMENR